MSTCGPWGAEQATKGSLHLGVGMEQSWGIWTGHSIQFMHDEHAEWPPTR
jgi:hypothetical protein